MRLFVPATASGLATLGFYKTGSFNWMYGAPLIILVSLNIAWWLTTRIRRGLASASH